MKGIFTDLKTKQHWGVALHLETEDPLLSGCESEPGNRGEMNLTQGINFLCPANTNKAVMNNLCGT